MTQFLVIRQHYGEVNQSLVRFSPSRSLTERHSLPWPDDDGGGDDVDEYDDNDQMQTKTMMLMMMMNLTTVTTTTMMMITTMITKTTMIMMLIIVMMMMNTMNLTSVTTTTMMMMMLFTFCHYHISQSHGHNDEIFKDILLLRLWCISHPCVSYNYRRKGCYCLQRSSYDEE